MTDLTVITPVALAHLPLLEQCRASVAGQTVPVAHLIKTDTEGRGPGYTRNVLLRQVLTPYVTFLDADDWLEPDFTERALAALRPHRYVYTDWFQNGHRIKAPKRAWCGGTFHLVTAVVPTDLVRAVGGFDERLRGMEDTDFYLKLLWRGVCGRRLPVPLVHYRANGGRADRLHASGDIDKLQAEISRRYGGRPLGCCGSPGIVDNTPVGQKREGDVLAQAQWGGNREEMGRATGRRYPRMSWPHKTWLDPRDAAAAPHLWQIVPEDDGDELEEEDEEAIVLRGVAALEASLMDAGYFRRPVPAPPAPLPTAPIPNFRRVQRLAGALDLPVFVAPRKHYPSYDDFWRLVELSGFEVRYPDEIDLRSDQVFVFTGPEGIPDCTGARARTIFWQLEYTGDYTRQANLHTVREVWSSEPSHARRTGARYLLLGSHRGLNPDLSCGEVMEYDLTMLAYQTPRRAAIRDQLSAWRWAPTYPGHRGADRHHVLRHTRLMLHVHQHEEPALAPLRLALAAAYQMPVIAEAVPDAGPYVTNVMWAAYADLPEAVQESVGKQQGEGLYELLCEAHPFDRCVLEALA